MYGMNFAVYENVEILKIAYFIVFCGEFNIFSYSITSVMLLIRDLFFFLFHVLQEIRVFKTNEKYLADASVIYSFNSFAAFRFQGTNTVL